ncbi:unnamed protein product [Rotaria socialis]|uniref:NAD(P)(+)--arginine ADP-ribosyltransferase n=1 Tax=Rotaria socialis TaxID=392032 RepID=A0A818AIU0_9BILA|nr:unnamed protein product [Rotaria socialis]
MKPVELASKTTAIIIDDEDMNNRRQITNQNMSIGIDQNRTTFNNEETTNGRQLRDHDLEIQDELKVIVLDDKETGNQGQIMIADVAIKGCFSKDVQMVGLKLNGDETLDQNQVPTVLKDSNLTTDSCMKNNQRVVENPTQEVLNIKNTFNEMSTDIGPVVGYANEPLLPLFKACAPLNEILHNMSFYVQLALHETPEQPPDGLTIDESAAIRLYTIEWEAPHRSLYSMLNHTLKMASREELRPYFKYLKIFVTALAKLPCNPPATVWRGVTKDLSEQFPPETLVTWWAFTSCTTNLTVLENNMYLGNAGSRTLFSVEAINGRSVRAHSHFDTEDEILLLPGTHMIVQSQVSPAPDLHIVHLKQIIPEEVLLESPFEGITNNLIQ